MSKFYIKKALKVTRILLHSFGYSAVKGRLYGPRVIVNSIPKAGTNLMLSCLGEMPLLRQKLRTTLKPEEGDRSIHSALQKIRNGQYVPAHLPYKEILSDGINRLRLKHIFVVRDLRDIVLSTINYITKIDTNHPHAIPVKRYTQRLDQIKVLFEGDYSAGVVPLRRYIESYHNWLNQDNCYVVQYECLMGGGDEFINDKIECMAKHIFGPDIDVDANSIRLNMVKNTDPTFHEPGILKWQKALTKQEVEYITVHLANSLKTFGYLG